MKGIKQFADDAAKANKQRADQEKAYAAKMKAWRAKYTAGDIRRMAEDADFIGIGRVCSGPLSEDAGDYFDFAVSEILKGQRRREFTGEFYFVTVPVPAATSELIAARDRDFVLFLSDENAKFGDARDYYLPVPTEGGMVEADVEALRAARMAVSAK